MLKYLAFFLILNLAQLNNAQDGCELIKPQCRCDNYSDSFDTFVTCDEFDSFEQIDLSPLTNVTTLELRPRVALVLNDSLKIANLQIRSSITLVNIDGIDLFANPFRSAILGKKIRLNIKASNIRTIQPTCDSSLMPDQYVSLFSMFDDVNLSGDVSYKGELCPLIFYNTNLSYFVVDVSRDNNLKFAQLTSADEAGFDLNAHVDYMFVGSFNSSVSQVVIDDQIIDKHAFRRLKRFTVSSVNSAHIDERAFYHAQNLIDITLTVNNMKTFIQSSNHTWMTNLNRNIRVNFTDPNSIAENLENALLVTFDTRNSDFTYLYPDEDLVYFSNFPHERFVFAHILAREELECSETLRWLVQNAQYYEPIMSLNSTATMNCLTSRETIKSTSIWTNPVLTSTTRPWTNNTETESKQVLLRVYLWTVIPIGVVCLFAIIGCVVFLVFYISSRSRRIRIENDKNNFELNSNINNYPRQEN